MVIIEILGSLTFALVLISMLGLTLITSTTLESIYGTPFAQRFFYQSGWFDAFLGLLAVNILCSALLRFPYKKRHTGFVMTHIGILLLLVGSFLTRLTAVEGQVMLFEGQKKDSIVQNTYEFVVHLSDGKFASFGLTPNHRDVERGLALAGGPLKITIHRFWNNALIINGVTNSPSAPLNHAVRLALSSEKTGVKEDVWLVENNPLDPGANRFLMGPAMFEIAAKPEARAAVQVQPEPPQSPTLHLYKKDQGVDFSVDLKNIPTGEIPAGQSGFTISHIRYYPDARVGDNNTLVNNSDTPQNPAIEFDVTGPDHETEHYIKFALFPEFESLHEKKSKKHFDLSVDLLTPSQTGNANGGGPSLSIYYSADGTWSYSSKSSKAVTEGDLKTGQTYQTGWMDFSFRVESLLDHAAVMKHVEQGPDSGKGGQPAAEVSLIQNGKTLFKDWLLEDDPQTVEAGPDKLMILVQTKNEKIPFSLELKKFRKIEYPGTHQPSAFESDVTLTDPKENLTLSKTISMNHPLEYKGYRIFQSSYVDDPASGQASIFTVAKNPGIGLIYGGAIVTFLGIFLVFFVPPFSSMIKESKK